MSQPIRPYTSVHVDWTHRTLVFVNMPLPSSRTGDGKVGIDRGCVHTLALSDGTFMDMPKPSKAELKRLKHLQRRMARQDRVNEARGGRTAKFASKRRRKTLNQSMPCRATSSGVGTTGSRRPRQGSPKRISLSPWRTWTSKP